MKISKDYLKKIIIEEVEEITKSSDPERFKYNLEEIEHSTAQIQIALSKISDSVNKLKEMKDFSSPEGKQQLKNIEKIARSMTGKYNRRFLGPIENSFADIKSMIESIYSTFKKDVRSKEAEQNKLRNDPEIDKF